MNSNILRYNSKSFALQQEWIQVLHKCQRGLGKVDIKNILERAADIYNKFTAESLTSSKEKALASVKRVDYMNVYTSDLVKAVRKAAGNIGITSIYCFWR